MKKLLLFLVVFGILLSCSSKENDSQAKPDSENPTAQLVGTWEYFRGVVLPCDSFNEIDDYPIDEFNRNIWESDGTFYREYNDDGTLESYTGKWTLLEQDGNTFKYKTEIDGISGNDTIYVLFKNSEILVYDMDCYDDSSYDPSFIREAGEARKID